MRAKKLGLFHKNTEEQFPNFQKKLGAETRNFYFAHGILFPDRTSMVCLRGSKIRELPPAASKAQHRSTSNLIIHSGATQPLILPPQNNTAVLFDSDIVAPGGPSGAVENTIDNTLSLK